MEYESVTNKAKIIIIGAGFAGLAAAIRLKEEGETDFLILERGDDVGGVWRDNHYPGCACDVESHLYSFSFAPNPKWSHKFARQPEIYSYLKEVAESFNLYNKLRFQINVQGLDWKTSESEWHIKTNKGEYRARLVVGAFGALSEPAIPQLKGIDEFKGQTFHSAVWPEDFKPDGKKVAVVGTGASAIQFIPEIQPDVSQLTVFQRTPPWVLPRLDGPISESGQKRYRQMPVLQKLARLKIFLLREIRVMGFRHPKMMRKAEKLALDHLYKAVKDSELREKLTPSYKMGCKRILLSNAYYPSLAQANVRVNSNEIKEIKENAVIDAEGNQIEVDTIIYGTGFQVTEMPFAKFIFGRRGQSLHEAWKGSPKAYLGTTVSGFPNLFLLQGPNTGLGHTSVILMIEAQVEHMIKTIKHMNLNKVKSMEPSAEAQQRFVEQTDLSMEGTVWTAGGCASWYLDQTGRNSTLWPGYTISFKRLANRWKAEDYVLK